MSILTENFSKRWDTTSGRSPAPALATGDFVSYAYDGRLCRPEAFLPD